MFGNVYHLGLTHTTADFPGFNVFDLPNNRKFKSDAYQDDPPPLIRPPSQGSRRNPEVKFRYSEKATKFEKNLPLKIWHY